MKYEVRVSDDKMEAYLILRDDGINYEITSDDVLKALEEAGVKYGIQYEGIKEIVEKPEFDTPYIVAIGKKPVDGEDGKLEIYHKEAQENEEKGRVDFREMAAKKSRMVVKKGDVLGKITESSPGIPGIDIYGNSVKPNPGKPVSVKIGEGILIKQDGTLVADKGGMLRVKNDEIYIEDVLVIKEDVDYSTGNINFPGFVEIHGDVKPGFVVKAKKDIQIKGIVEAATVISFEGSIELTGVKGKEKGMIKAKQDVKAKFLENAHVEAGGTVEVDGPITNSNVKAREKVILKGRKGVLVGGITMTSNLVEAEEIGSPLGVRTHIEIGIDPEIREEEKLLTTKLNLDKENLDKLLSILKGLKKLKDAKGSLPKAKEEIYKKVSQSIINLKNMMEQNNKELLKIRKEYSKTRKSAKVIARKVIHPGVEVIMFDRKISISKPVEKALLVVDEKQDSVVIRAYTGS
ncbi:MAG: DUF342 domain-containing protein [Thermotogaceae bacterium]|nr:DUF342 domain-containing protein [Thermotogaceae bacterium]